MNRILVESSHGEGCRRTTQINETLLSLVLDFVEPYLADKLTERYYDRPGKNEGVDGNKSTESNIPSIRYRDRAVTWAIERINDLMRPIGETDIPELDALLSATGPHVGLAHEKCMHKMLVSSLSKKESTCFDHYFQDDFTCKSELGKLSMLLDSRRRNLATKQKNDVAKTSSFLNDGLGNNTKGMNDTKTNLGDGTEQWSLNPDTWFAELRGHGFYNNAGSDSRPTNSHSSAIAAHPFLGQMHNFLKRHNKTEKEGEWTASDARRTQQHKQNKAKKKKSCS